MRLLLISDTHGHLESIHQWVRKTGADAVVHAGDFGFYDDKSLNRLSDRELALQIRHSHLPGEVRRKAFKMSHREKVELIREEGLLSELPMYLEGQKAFEVPVYAVWGNHEDLAVVRAFRDGTYRVPNLFVLDEDHTYTLDLFCLFGLGGNLLTDKRFFQEALAGNGGKVWSTLSQYVRLWDRVQEEAETGRIRVMVSHVSPGKEPLLAHFAALLQARYVVSGHMGSPYACTWSPFSVQELGEVVDQRLEAVQALIDVADKVKVRDAETRSLVKRGLDLLSQPLTAEAGRHPDWYRTHFSINLPDAEKTLVPLTVFTRCNQHFGRQ